jgi:acyl-CoA ligase (AMP-forming) (exosortase A-associated)
MLVPFRSLYSVKGVRLSAPDPVPHPLDHLARFEGLSRPALISGEYRLDYAALEIAVGRLARGLSDLGLARGARVASWLPKTVEACLMSLATARAGLIHVPVNPVLKRTQVAHILADSGASLLLTGEGRAASLNAADVPPNCAVWPEMDARAAWQDGDARGPSSADTDDLAAILYTSGSTGRPKGVMLSHANLWLGAVSVAHYLGLTPDDRTLCVLPLSFDYGQNQLFSTWRAGGCAIALDYLTPRDVVRAIGRHDVNTFAGVPPLWVQLLETEWPPDTATKLRRITNSGGALTPALVSALAKLLPNADIVPMYGLTEAFRSTYLDPALVTAHPDSMGRAIPFAEIMVVRPDGSAAAPGESGELVHAGPLVAKGYWGDAAQTAERFKPAPSWSHYGGMAVWSGDTVRTDDAGLLYFVGRDDEMIKTSGNRVSPVEVEMAANASGLIAESVAFGVPDARLGQAIMLVVRPTSNVDKNDLKQMLMSYLKIYLPTYMLPRSVSIRADLPRNANGKLDRAALKGEMNA